MNESEIFIQAEGRDGLFGITVGKQTTWAQARQLALETIEGLEKESFILLLQDVDELIEDERLLEEISRGEPLIHAHLHRCRRIEVSVHYSGRTFTHQFAPSATIGRVKTKSATSLGMSEADAAEHVLQLAGTSIRPDPGTHIGTLAKHPHCSIQCDLAFSQRIHG